MVRYSLIRRKVALALSLGLLSCLLFNCGATHSSLQDGEKSPAWNSDALQTFRDFNEGEVYFPHHVASTLWSGVQAQRAKSVARDFFQAAPVRVLTESGSATTITTILHRNPQPRGVLIVLPGIGAEADSDLAARQAYHFAGRGFTTLSLPSPFSPSFIRLALPFRPGDMLAEGRFFLQFIDSALSQLQLPTDNVHVVGESYGAFLAAVVAAYDQERSSPRFASVTAFGPPLDFALATRNVDLLLDQEDSNLGGLCRGTLSGIVFLRDYARAARQSELAKQTQQCSKTRLARDVFKTTLIDAVLALEETHQIGLLPTEPNERAHFLESIRFHSFLDNYSPTAAELLRDPDLPRIGHWLAQSSARVLTAADDFLNTTFERQPSDPGEQFASLGWGGHLGFVGFPWFDERLVTVLYGQRQSGQPFQRLRHPLLIFSTR
jgi:pimeloyl-ACP methyl ester carboxylesterase